MKYFTHSLACSLALISSTNLLAQKAESVAQPVQMEQENAASPFSATVTLPLWATGIEGDISALGLTAGLDAGVDDIINNLDMILAGGLELRYERFGLIFDSLYIKGSISGENPGPLLSGIDVGIEQLLAEAALSYRVFENDKGWFDLLLGARYIYVGGTLNLRVDTQAVRSVSEQLSSAVVDQAAEIARKEVNQRLAVIKQDVQNAVLERRDAALDRRDAVSKAIEDRVANKVEEIRGTIRDRIDGGIGGDRSEVARKIGDSGRIRDAIREYAKAAAQTRIEAARAEASAAIANARNNASQKVSAAISRAQKKAEKRLAKAEKNLANALEKEINSRIPDSEISASRGWVDPFVGFRTQYAFSDDWYAAARGDVGGFGISSDLTLNFFGGLGYRMNQNASIELGYRYFSVDYKSGDFAYDTVMQGPYVGLSYRF